MTAQITASKETRYIVFINLDILITSIRHVLKKGRRISILIMRLKACFLPCAPSKFFMAAPTAVSS